MAPDDKKNNPAAPDAKSDANAKENVAAAHDQAEKDIAQDADLSISSPNDDLDEGETARLGEDVSGIV